MTDELIERVAQAICDGRGWDMANEYWGPLCRKDAQAALAALEPGDELGKGLYVRHEPWVAAGLPKFPQQLKEARTKDIAHKALKAGAEEMRERICAFMEDQGRDTCQQEFRETLAAIRALPLEEEK